MKRTMLTTQQIADCLQTDGNYWGQVQETVSRYPGAQDSDADDLIGPELYADLSELNRQYGLPPAVDGVLYNLLTHDDPGDLGSWWDGTDTNRVWGSGVYLEEGRLTEVTWAMHVGMPACERDLLCQECLPPCQMEADSDEHRRMLSNVKLAFMEDGPAGTSDPADTTRLVDVEGVSYLRHAAVSMNDGLVATVYYWLKLPFLPRNLTALEQVEMSFEFWKPGPSAFVGTVRTVNVPGPLGDQRPGRSVFRKCGEAWEIAFKGRKTFLLNDIDGLAYLRYLLAQPHFDFASTHLSSLVKKYGPGAPLALVVDPDDDEEDRPFGIKDLGLNQEQLDKKSREAYRHRIKVIEIRRRRAEESGDKEEVSKLIEERKIIAGVLYAAEGFGQKARHFPDPGSRSRIAVKQAIQRALAKIEEYDPLLKVYLDLTIDTGYRIGYHPDPSAEIVEWDT